MKSYETLQEEVGQWAENNFGDCESPYFILKINPFPEGWRVGDEMPGTLVAMESLCPLMGIAEEVGELAIATSPEEIEDAIGDVFIYVCDYTYRMGFNLPIGENVDSPVFIGSHTLNGIVGWTGSLFHATLKRHEGIRGFDDDEKYLRHCMGSVKMLLIYLAAHAKANHLDLLQVANKVWNKVSKRDWIKSPTDGACTTTPVERPELSSHRKVPNHIFEMSKRLRRRDME